MSTVVDKFLKYVTIDTQSDEDSTTSPSTEKQKDLARLLVGELKEMGASDVRMDEEYGYVYATIPSTLKEEGKEVPVIGFIAHMDTSPAVSGKDVKPRIVENYDGKDIVLNQELNIILPVEENPELLEYEGKKLIVTDGTTLLGADDKAGVAEIMTMAQTLLAHPEKEHGTIRIAFTLMKKWEEGWIILTWKDFRRIMPILWTAARWESWNTKKLQRSRCKAPCQWIQRTSGSAKK